MWGGDDHCIQAGLDQHALHGRESGRRRRLPARARGHSATVEGAVERNAVDVTQRSHRGVGAGADLASG